MELRAATDRTVEAFNGDGFDAILDVFHPEVELVSIRALPEGTVYRGDAGLEQFECDSAACRSERRVELTGIEVRDDAGLAAGRLRMRGGSPGSSPNATALGWFACATARSPGGPFHPAIGSARAELGREV